MINLALAEFLFALILLGLSYSISHTINGFLQACITNTLGDPTAKDQGFMTLNPLHHIDIFGMVILVFLGFGWLQTVPIDPYAIQGRLRYIRLFIAYMAEATISVLLATVSLTLAVLTNGFATTSLLLVKLFTYYSNFYTFFFSSKPILNIAAVFPEGHSTLAIAGSFLLVSLVYLNILISMISLIFNAFRYLLVIGFEQGYRYIEYADYLAILGPFCVVFFLGEMLIYYLLQVAEIGACFIACLFGM